jgi:hypothetical protein
MSSLFLGGKLSGNSSRGHLGVYTHMKQVKGVVDKNKDFYPNLIFESKAGSLNHVHVSAMLR